MVEILRLLLNCLSETVWAWEGFQRREIGYFQPENHSPTGPRSMPDCKLSIEAIDKAYSELRILQCKLQAMRTQLVVDNRQAVSHSLSLTANGPRMLKPIKTGQFAPFLREPRVHRLPTKGCGTSQSANYHHHCESRYSNDTQ